MTDGSSAKSSLALRKRWAGLLAAGAEPVLRVGLLATYTIDSIVPYAGVRLHEWGLPAELVVGPYNQIVQQCLGDTSEMGRLRPDVLVVAPRFEELAAHGDGVDLLMAVEAAKAAAARWQAALVVALPAIPEHRPYGVGDAGRADGVVAMAESVRGRLRAGLAGRPNVHLVDVEQVIRTVGAAQAHRPAMYQVARVPYSEQVFDQLAWQLVRVLRLRYGGSPGLVVVDADGFSAHDDPAVCLTALADQLTQLRRAGVRLAVRGSGEPAHLWSAVAGELPELGADPRVKWIAGQAGVAEQCAALRAEWALPSGRPVVLTVDTGLADSLDDSVGCVLLGGEPGLWPTEMLASWELDLIPPGLDADTSWGGSVVEDLPLPDAEKVTHGWNSLGEFIDGLQVNVSFRDLPGGLDAETEELVARAHDFTLGTAAAPHEPAPGEAGYAIAAEVTDRLGDYGTSAVAVVRCVDGVCHVEVFSVSCPALGRGVEDAVLEEIVARAARHECRGVVIGYRETTRNQIAVHFLRGAEARDWGSSSEGGIKLQTVHHGDAA